MLGLGTCKDFDERQQLLRGRICKHILVMLVAAIMINAFAEELGFVWQDKLYGNFILIMIPVAIGTIEMNIYGAYLNKHSQNLVYFFGVIVLMNLVTLVLHPEPLMTEGALSVFGQRIIVEVCFVIVFLSTLIRLIYDKKQTYVEE